MAVAPKSPGVQREEVFLKPHPQLATGVPAFVGFAAPKPAPGSPPASPPRADGNSKRPEPGVPFALRRKAELADNFSYPADGFLVDAVAAFFDNGGERCYVVAAAGRDAAALEAAIDALAPVEDLDLLAVPDAMMLRDHDVIEVQRHAVEHCAVQGDRFAILDAPRGSTVDAVL